MVFRCCAWRERPRDRWPGDRRGAIAVLFALTSTMSLTVLALAADVGLAYIKRAQMQQASDAAALAGGMTYQATSSLVATEAAIQDVVVANGFPSSAIQNPLLTYLTQSPFNASFGGVQVVLRSTSPVSFGSWIINSNAFTLQTKSVAQIGGISAPGNNTSSSNSGNACILALDLLAVSGTINVSNGNISAQVCAVVANGLITLGLGANINANAILSGGLLSGLLGSLTSGTLLSNTTVTNPYAGVSGSNPYSSCTTLNVTTSANSTLTPGCYNLTTSVPVTLTDNSGQPGLYYFSNLTVNNGGSVNGSDVTAIVNSALSPQGPLNLTAPASGLYNGIALYANSSVSFTGGQWTINGAIYAPFTTLLLTANDLNINACVYIVAQNVAVSLGVTVGDPQVGCNSFGPNHDQSVRHPTYGPGTVFLVQ